MTLTFNPLQAMAMAYLHAKVQGQRLVGSKETGNKRTDRRTDGGDCITSHANAVDNNTETYIKTVNIRHKIIVRQIIGIYVIHVHCY